MIEATLSQAPYIKSIIVAIQLYQISLFYFKFISTAIHVLVTLTAVDYT
jgi:hypothetical protein